MVHISRKKINGKEYTYAIKSIRLPDGSLYKISKIIQTAKEVKSKKMNDFFGKKEIDLFTKYVSQHYSPMKLHDKDALRKMEEMRIEYKKIISSLSPNQLKDLFDRFTVNFTYESNAIEGNSLTLKDVAIVIHENSSIKGKDLREIYETRNSREVVDLILRKKFKAREQDALKMHAMLVKDMGISKGYKKFPNYLEGRQIQTTPPENVPIEMEELFRQYESGKLKMHPLQLAVRLHGRFEQIHPFEDGNGRVGRFLVNVILVSVGYPPLIIRKTQRISYLNALEDFDKGRPQTLEQFLYERLKETHEKFFKIYVKYL